MDPNSTSQLDSGRFPPGTELAGRFRISGRLGAGGMGEVYRAEDLQLGQVVALKFLPSDLARDERWLDRFRDEVRIARQIAHPNVTRVYDIGSVDDETYLSMEYVDGEDLASLLRRIGRLPQEKALDIARQLCAGLHAVHEKGVLHRDLKPQNVMIDGKGKVRLTDFGLAALVEDTGGAVVGTPAYMAPEQLKGKEVSEESDIYSLGLVLYEVFTGRAVHAGKTVAELLQNHDSDTLPTPSSVLEEIDPSVEQVMLRCLESDSRLRPSSALAVAAALPGGDPLAEALAAGELPSPDMVAEAGDAGSIRPKLALAAFLAAAAGLATIVSFAGPQNILHHAPLQRAPEALVDRARDTIGRLGVDWEAADWALGLHAEQKYLDHLSEHDDSPDRWKRLGSGGATGVRFWYRQGTSSLIPRHPVRGVEIDDPPPLARGMVTVETDVRGRLLAFLAVPPEGAAYPRPGTPPDWDAPFREAELDPASFAETPVEIDRPLLYSETLRAWTGPHPDEPELEVRIVAGAVGGFINQFRVLWPWEVGSGATNGPTSGPSLGLLVLVLTMVVGILVAGLWLALRNLRLGRGDRRGARRLGGFIFVTTLVVSVIFGRHTFALWELERVPYMIGFSLFVAACAWSLYLALEPFVRRRWPHALISWTRAIGGRFRDPLVGRDVLLGTGVAIAMHALDVLGTYVPVWRGEPPRAPLTQFRIDGYLSGEGVLGMLAGTCVNGVLVGMGTLLFFLLLRVVLRRDWLAFAAYLAIFFVIALPSSGGLLGAGLTLIVNGATLLVLMRFGVLAYIVLQMVNWLLTITPFTWDTEAHHALASFAATAALLLLALQGFRAALAGRPLFRDEFGA